MRKLSFALIAVMLIAGCAAMPSAAGTGMLQLKVTDQAHNITSFNITVDKITAHFSNQTVTATENDTEGVETNETEEGTWITSFTGPKTIDLVDVKTIYDILGETELASGTYTQIRVYVSSASVTTENGTSELKIPSGSIKLVRPFTIEPNKTTSLVLDWDADTSVVFAGPNVIFKPVVRIFTEFTGKTKTEADDIKASQALDATAKRELRKIEQNKSEETPAPNAKQIYIRNFIYTSAEIRIPVGTTVIWTNRDNEVHTVTSNSGLFDSGPLGRDESWSYIFTEPGNYYYHCEEHPYNGATVHVY